MIGNGLAQDLFLSIQAAANMDGASTRQLRECGLFDFVKLDAHASLDARSLARLAMTLCIGKDGHWDPMWRAIVQGTIGFIIEHNWPRPTRTAIQELQTQALSKPSRAAIEQWFDTHFPAM